MIFFTLWVLFFLLSMYFVFVLLIISLASLSAGYIWETNKFKLLIYCGVILACICSICIVDSLNHTVLGYAGAILIPGHHMGKPETLHHISEYGESKVCHVICFFQIVSLLQENHQVNKNLCWMHGKEKKKNPSLAVEFK